MKNNIKKCYFILSGKGGVGKTTMAVNLAYVLSKKYKVGLLDIDITGPNVPKMMGLEGQKMQCSKNGFIPVEKDGIKVVSMAFLLETQDTPVIWMGPLRGKIIKQFVEEVIWGDIDYLIVDLPPGTGDEPLSIAKVIPNANGVILVSTPQEISLLDVGKAINFSKKLDIPIVGLIENMSEMICPHCNKKIMLFGMNKCEKIAEKMGIPYLGKLPFELSIVSAGDDGKPYLYRKESQASKVFENILEVI